MAEFRLGDYLLEQGILTHEQLQKALAEQSITNRRLGDVIIDLGFSKEEDVVSALSEQMGIAFIDLTCYEVEKEVLEILNEKTAHRLQVVPVFKIENTLTVVMADPLDINAVDELNLITGMEIQPCFGTKSSIKATIDKHYKKTSDLEEAISSFKQTGNEEISKSKIFDISTEENNSDDAPSIRMVNLILSQSVKDGASDIHFEPDDSVFHVRCRIDGILYRLVPPPKALQNAIISRIKVIANLDIAEKRKPQDGSIQINIENKTIDLRVSTFPTIHGENIVVRILDKSIGIRSLESLGFQNEMLSNIKHAIKRPFGIILVTGPTGSGKTTTLYSCLKEINRDDINIMTLEDPVEYQIKGIRQAHVDPKGGLTFQTGLRSLLRQDPDVIMIGEIRDKETAEIATQAALTGHLVFSTLHTNDSASTIARLIDMGIEPFLISSSLSAIIAQKLVRKLCDNCKTTYKADTALLKTLNLSENDDISFFKPNGCDFCRNTGYKGRIGVYELLVPTPEICHLINEKKSSIELQKAINDAGFITKKMDGIHKAIIGQTSIQEVLGEI